MPHFRRVGSLKVSTYVLAFCKLQSTANVGVQMILALPRQIDPFQTWELCPGVWGDPQRLQNLQLPLRLPRSLISLGVEVWGAAFLTWHSCLLSLEHYLNRTVFKVSPGCKHSVAKTQGRLCDCHSSVGTFVLGPVFIFHWNHVVVSAGIFFYFLWY